MDETYVQPQLFQRVWKRPSAKVEATCEHCRAVFLVYPTKLRHGRARFCSKRCLDDARRTSEERTCQECGSRFTIWPAEIRKGGGVYCSRGCADKGRIGKRTIRFKGGVERRDHKYTVWRKAIYERDNHTCQDCGAAECEIHAHHIKRWRTHPDLRYEITNGVTLCGPCHYKRHRKQATSNPPE